MTKFKFHILVAFSLIQLLLNEQATSYAPVYYFQTDTTKTDSTHIDSLRNLPYTPTFLPTFQQQDRFGDPFSNNLSPSPLLLQDPATLQLDLEIDTGMNYTIYEKIGAINYRPTSTMSFEEFNRYQDSKMKKEYWQNRSAGLDGESAVSGRRLIPELFISPIFDRIFGGSTVDIEPNGFINLDFGGRWQKIENPQIPVNQQRNGGFNFNQQISMNVVGKVGEKLAITANFDNNNSFDFQNNMKMEYTGYDEDIIKKIEVGNVSMPVSNSLMRGGQSLFGIKTELQFGKLFVTGVASRQQGSVQTKTFDANGVEGTTFEKFASEYDEYRHFFLGHFFRDNYERWLNDLPQINSGIIITRVEVYIVNNNNETAAVRNFLGMMDLGETDKLFNDQITPIPGNIVPASNDANDLFGRIKDASDVRNIETVGGFLQSEFQMTEGTDYEVRQIARKLDPREYKWNERLGYISLQRRLQTDEVLAVSYEYYYRNERYVVGELSEAYQQRPDDDLIILKMLKPTSDKPELPIWDLSMKNVYNLNTVRINPEGFELRINYRDDINNYDAQNLNEGRNTNNIPLIEILKLDQLNVNGDPQKDGKFDYVPNVTFDEEYGNVIFPVLEPFGATLENTFAEDEQRLKDKYVFHELYTTRRQQAELVAAKNKFYLTGKMSGSTSGGSIPIGAFNISQGSVVVRAGGDLLQEGLDYNVSYQGGGSVTITKPGVFESGKKITIDYETDDLFNFQSRWLTGLRADYRFTDNINIGATVLHLNERPGGVTRYKIGDEPTKNTKYGFDVNYQKESRLLTKIVDALPVISTKEQSNINFSGEFAQLVPGTSNVVNGKGISYIDDFETSITPYNMGGGHIPWKLATTPSGSNDSFDQSHLNDTLGISFKRAKLAWYIIDRAFYTNIGNSPDIPDVDMENHYVRQVFPQDIFSQRDRQVINLNEPVFDLAYYPNERGPYNYNPNLDSDGNLVGDPRENFGAITRALNGETNFLNTNMEYIEFWLMDPFIDGDRGVVDDGRLIPENNDTGGELVFNLGLVSEDLHRDNGLNEFEHGLPADGSDTNTERTPWGRRTTVQPITDFFDNSSAARANQDVGIDGLNSARENERFLSLFTGLPQTTIDKISADISADDFRYFLDAEYDERGAKVLERYKEFNGQEGNSPVSTGGSFTASATNLPDKEDIFEDDNITKIEDYFEYRIDLRKGLDLDHPYIVDGTRDGQGANWFLFRIPIRQPTALVGQPDLSNVKHLRMFMTGWEQPVVLRMVKFQMVASQWRKYEASLSDEGFDLIPEEGTSDFEVSVVNIEENSTTADDERPPYVLPPGINRDLDNTTAITRRDNEQSIKICVRDLEDRDARAVYKEENIDLINYGRIKMFFHAEAASREDFDANRLRDGDVSAFLRLGADQDDNYYEIEVPLTVTPYGLGNNPDPSIIWPEENEIDLALGELYALKSARNRSQTEATVKFSRPSENGQYNLSIVGNPKLTTVLQMMIGVRNVESGDDIEPKSICIWANELRVTDFDRKKGWAANARLSMKLADLATVNASTRYTSVGFGGIQQRISERTREEEVYYDVSANINVDKFLPGKHGIKVPMFVSYEKRKATPFWDPLDTDIPLEDSANGIDDEVERETYKDKVIDQTTRKSINFINVRKEKVKPDAKKHIYDIENLSFNYSYSESRSSNVNTAENTRKDYRGGVNYQYSPQSPSLEPFKNSKALDSKYLQLIKDINFSPLPNNISVRANMDRSFTKRQLRNADLTTDGIDPNFEKFFNFNRVYNVRWSIFKSMTLNYNATANAIIDEPEGEINTRAERDSIWSNVKRLGRMKRFDQSMGLTYRLPLSKIPLTDWVNADYRYDVNYNWASASFNQIKEFGNVVSNSRTQDINGKIDLVKLYNKSGYLKKINSPRRSRRPTSSRRPQPADTLKKSGDGSPVVNGFLRLLMSLRSINVTLGQRESTSLPGFTPTPYLFGAARDTKAPGMAFILGSQDPNIRFDAADNGWLVQNQFLTAPFQQSKTNDLNIRASVEPLKDLKIQLDMKRQITSGYQEFFVYDSIASIGSTEPIYASQSPSRSGSYTVTFLPIGTSFIGDNGDLTNDVFTRFEDYRSIILGRLELLNNNGQYNLNSQDVLLPAFIAAYTGRDPNTIGLTPFPKTPMPNWRLDYAGLSKIPKFKEIFSSINLTHAYSSTFSITNYINSSLYNQDLDLSQSILDYPMASVEENGSLVPVYLINQVDVVERFSPLIGINIRTKNRLTTKIEYKKERNLTLHLNNSQVTEMSSNDFTFDFGLTKDKMKIPFKINGQTVVLENDLQIRVAFTVRDTQTIQRKLDDVHTITDGNINYQIRPTMSYVANQKLNITMYFERNINQPKVSRAFNRATSAFGIQVRFSLSQ